MRVYRAAQGYLPVNRDRRDAVLQRKREEYHDAVGIYCADDKREENKQLFHQIHIDIPRTSPDIALFQHPAMQSVRAVRWRWARARTWPAYWRTAVCAVAQMMERILYLWAIRHPASGYVQGINDLVCPFVTVFLSSFVGKPAIAVAAARVDACQWSEWGRAKRVMWRPAMCRGWRPRACARSRRTVIGA